MKSEFFAASLQCIPTYYGGYGLPLWLSWQRICHSTGDLGWEDPLEKGKTTHSSILAWRIPRTIRVKWCCESAALNMPANLENTTVATGLEKVRFHPNP